MRLPPLRRSLVFTLTLLLATTATATPDKWTADIDRFTTGDAAHPPAQHAVVFVGSSSIRLWTTLDKDFPGVTTINRGSGGSELVDSVFYADRIVIPYHPRVVVLFAGTDARCTFVDVFTPMLDAEGRIRPEHFQNDQLHMKPAGYAIWTKVLAPHLQP